ncbi:MAG: response regulator [Rhodospirillaceae bacterium]
MHVLIVDDNPMMRLLLERAVNSAGVSEIDFVGNGAEALRCYKHRCHDLILLDQNMPQMTGTELLVNLRGHPGLTKTHVIMVTGAVDKQLVALIKSGQVKVDDLIVKPFDVTKLASKIADIMTRTRDSRRADGPILKQGAPKPELGKVEASPTLKCTVIDRGGIAILEMAGHFTHGNRAIVNAAFKELQNLHAKTVILDLNNVVDVDNSGLGLIMVINGWLNSLDRQGFISFGKFPERERIISLGITSIMPIRERTNEAF